MYYEFTGNYKTVNNELYLFNKRNNKTYKITGEEVELLIEVLPYLTGTYSFNRICNVTNIKANYIQEFIDLLIEQGLIRSFEEIKIRLFLLNDGHKESKTIQKYISQNEKLYDVDIKSGIKDIEVNSKIPTLIIAINHNYNKKFIRDIETLSLSKQANFLNVSIIGDRGFIGPLFSFEDGPCSQCLDRRSLTKNTFYQEPLGHLNDVLAEMVVNEVVRFIRDDTYVNTFNTVIEINFSELNIEKTRIFKYPGCKQCELKQELVR